MSKDAKADIREAADLLHRTCGLLAMAGHSKKTIRSALMVCVLEQEHRDVPIHGHWCVDMGVIAELVELVHDLEHARRGHHGG